MSTAALERRAGQRMRGSGMHILAYYTYFAYSAKVQISKEAYRSGKPPFEKYIFNIFNTFYFCAYFCIFFL